MTQTDRRGFILASAVAAAVFPQPVRAQNAAGSPYKIGVTFPLTGPLAVSANDYLPGAQIAVDDINRAGGISGHPLQLVVEDTQGGPQGGVAAMRKVVQVDGAQAVLTIFTNVVTAQMPLAEQLKVPILSTIETPGLVSKNPYAFAHAASIGTKGKLFGQYWKSHNVKRVYGFIINNAFGPFMSTIAKQAAQNAGTEYAESSFNDGDTDYRGLVARAKEFNPDGVFISQLGGVSGAVILRQVREAGMNATAYLPGIFYDEESFRNAVGPYAENTMIMAGITLDPVAAKQFISAFRIRTGHIPTYQAGEQYDIIQMFAAAIRRGGYNGEAIRNQLAVMKGVPSLFGGQIVMDPDHYSIPSSDTLWRVVKGKLQQVTV
jgi:branched-chain amino acid transport system substrate-binding protein